MATTKKKRSSKRDGVRVALYVQAHDLDVLDRAKAAARDDRQSLSAWIITTIEKHLDAGGK